MNDATANAVESLINLFYLIRLQSAVQKDVLLFVDMAQRPLETLTAAARDYAGIKAKDRRAEPPL